jgi:hypothetical protein
VCTEPLTDNVNNATALLYSQDSAGGMRMHCTSTAYERDEDDGLYEYTFLSAAHCIGNDNQGREQVADYRNKIFYITFDRTDPKIFYRAEVKSIGYQSRGDDFAELTVLSREMWPIIPIGDERKEEEGNEVVNVASPFGLGKQVFHGHITKLELDRPVVQGNINWTGVMLVQIPGTGGGSSGSAIISVKQEAIVGFLVGTISNTAQAAIPVSRFVEFKKSMKNGTYRWAIPEGEL